MLDFSIISYASGYSFDVYDRFVGTLNNTGFKGNIFIMIQPSDNNVLLKIQEKYNNVFTFFDSIQKRSHINCHRFFVIQQFLNIHNFDNQYIFLCDFRDVLFQKNIQLYNLSPDVDLYVFSEAFTIISEKNYNTPWLLALEQIFNEKFFNSISHNLILCCGTTLGKAFAIKEYVNKMCLLLSQHNIVYNLDQGIHNYLIYLNKFTFNVKILDNSDNLVFTAGCDIHKLNHDDFIVNKNDSVPFVVHQYDRFPLSLKKRLSAKFGFNFLS